MRVLRGAAQLVNSQNETGQRAAVDGLARPAHTSPHMPSRDVCVDSDAGTGCMDGERAVPQL